MAFNYSSIRWVINGEVLDASNLNRPLNDAVDLIAAYLDNEMYTRGQSDDRYYTKTFIDENFFTKTYINANFYTKDQSDSRYVLSSDIGDGFYTKDYIDENFLTKVQIETDYSTTNQIRDGYYNKSEVDDLLQGFSPENRFKVVELGESHIYTLEESDIGSDIMFVPTSATPSPIMTVMIPSPDFGVVGDKITLIAPSSNEFTDGDEAASFISTVGGSITHPRTAVGHLPAFRAGMSTVTMTKVSNTDSGMADWILSGDLALYTAADLWVELVLRAELFVPQAGEYIDYVLFPYQESGDWHWKPLAFAKEAVPAATTTSVRGTTDILDTLNIRSSGTVDDFPAFIVVTKPVPRGQAVQMTVTTNGWTTPGTAVVDFLEQLPETPDDIGTSSSFTGNRTYVADESLEAEPLYIAVKNTVSGTVPTNVNLSVQFVD